MPAARRVTRRPAEKPGSKPKFDFRSTLQQFLVNKAVAEAATLRNEGDKKAKVPGLKATLLAWVMEHGETDEKGSFFIDLDTPLDIAENGQRYTTVKAERRQGEKSLNADRTRELLEKKDLLDKVEEFQYVLRLDTETADLFAEWLKESGLITRVVSTDAVLIEDNLLALHHTKTGKKVTVVDEETGDKVKVDERLISEEELDGLYDTPDPTFAFKPLT